MIGAIVQFGHELGLRVIAEGVTSTPQLQAAFRLGCDAFSGPLAGGYVDAETAGALIEDGDSGYDEANDGPVTVDRSQDGAQADESLPQPAGV